MCKGVILAVFHFNFIRVCVILAVLPFSFTYVSVLY